MADAQASSGVDVAAVLLNWRGAACTLQCLSDLLQVSDVVMHVLVIDNGSGADEVAVLERGLAGVERSAHQVDLVPLPTNLGFTGGMNHGMQKAHQLGAAFVLVLNNDLRLPVDFLRPLVDVLRNDRTVAAVGPTVLHPDGTVWAEGGEVGFAPNALRLRRHGQQPRPRTHGPESVGFVPGACLLLRTAAATEAGYFDDRYFMYWEDVDLCQRLRQQGHGIVWLPWVQIEHLAGQSSGGGRSPLRKYLMAKNALRYLRRHGTAKGWLAWLTFDVLLWPLALVTGPRAAFAKLRGTLAGLIGRRADAADVARFMG